MKPRRWIVILSLLAGLGGTPARASNISLGIYGDDYGGMPFVHVSGSGGIVGVYAVIRNGYHIPIRNLKFAIQTPDCSGLTFLAASSVYGSYSASDVENGVSIDLGQCTGTDPLPVMYLIFAVTGTITTCCPVVVMPGQSVFYNDAEATKCDGTVIPMERSGCVIQPLHLWCGGPSVPADPWPPNGAVDVPLDPGLLWHCVAVAGTGIGEFLMRMYFGTSPNPPLLPDYVSVPWSVGPLQPSTTYYWKVFASTDYGTAVGPVWSFTTMSTTPVKRSTWGSVKALYRQ